MWRWVDVWGLASPPHPSGRTESCTLRILRMLLLMLTGEDSTRVLEKAFRRHDMLLNNCGGGEDERRGGDEKGCGVG